VDIDLTAEALEYGRQARRAIGAAGGDGLLRRAEADPAGRASAIAPVLGELGAWDLSPRTDPDDLEAAAALCRAAGHWALPYPVAERLARPVDLDADGLVVVTESAAKAAVAGLDLRWAAVTLDGKRSTALARAAPAPPRTSAFVADLDLEPLDGDGTPDVALAVVLPCWMLLGLLDRALELACAHVLVREQFGQPLARFQGVQFQLTEAEVERSGVEMLARYALWSVQAGLDEALDDALALRLAAVEAAEVVFRIAHQVHGAIGFCDESALSWLSRYSQPVRRLPTGRSATQDELTARLGRRGLSGLFDEPTGDRPQ
jgi:3-oxo-4-pregnene-20-carboxyl-CoA dehydrogenase alpha subunit